MPPAVGPGSLSARNECTILMQCTVGVHEPMASSHPQASHRSPPVGGKPARAKPLGVLRRRLVVRTIHLSPFSIGGTTLDCAKPLGVLRRRLVVRLIHRSPFPIGGNDARPCQSSRRFPPAGPWSAWHTAHRFPSAGTTLRRARALGVFRQLGRGPLAVWRPHRNLASRGRVQPCRGTHGGRTRSGRQALDRTRERDRFA